MMLNTKKKVCFVFLLVFVFVLSFNLASSQTLMTGKVYGVDGAPHTLSGANVKIICGTESEKNTLTGDDGIYVYLIVGDSCVENDDVEITASMNGYDTKSAQGTVLSCSSSNHDCTTNNVSRIAVVNVFLPEHVEQQSQQLSGGGGGYVPKTVVLPGVNATNQTTKIENTTSNETDNNAENETLNTNTDSGFLAAITGAFIGALGTGGSIAALAFILIIIALGIFFAVRNKKVKKK